MATGEWVGPVGDESERRKRGDGTREKGEGKREKAAEVRCGEVKWSEVKWSEHTLPPLPVARSWLCLAHLSSIARRALFTSCDVAISGLVRTSRNARDRSYPMPFARSLLLFSSKRTSSSDTLTIYLFSPATKRQRKNVNLSYFNALVFFLFVESSAERAFLIRVMVYRK